MADFQQKLLDHFHLSAHDYDALTKPVTFSSLPNPFLFSGMDKAISRIKQAINKKEKIIIYGDYDCDGIMATSILVKAFATLGVSVGYYLPSRYLEGYGLNEKKVDEIFSKGYKLIITVDNGISQNEAIEKANRAGIDVIVTDHHEPLVALPNAYAIIHPIVSHYGEIVCCGAYVSMMVATALLGKEDPYLVTLASIATISDMMVLKGYNRDIVRLGISYLNQYQYYPLIKLAESNLVDEEVFAMKIAPKLNAIGRMIEDSKINYLVQFLTTEKTSEVDTFYQWIEEVNHSRKVTMMDAFDNGEAIDLSKEAIVTITKEKEGLIGLLASRYLNLYNKVSIVFTEENNNPELLKGSARSKNGFSIAKAFSELSSLFVSYGGHDLAGGCTISRTNYPAFKKAFEDLADAYRFHMDEAESMEIQISDISWENFKFIKTLSPFGQGFRLPLFRLSHLKTSELSYISQGKHISSFLGANIKILGFSMPEKEISTYKYIDVYGQFTQSVFRERVTLDFRLSKYEPST